MRDALGEDGLLSDDNRPEAVFEERGRRYCGRNQARLRILRYRVDGEWKADGRKCDFAVCVPERGILILVELKGKDLSSAAEQLLGTLEFLRPRVVPTWRIEARIVLSRVSAPRLRPSAVIRLERALLEYAGTLVKQSRRLTEDLS